MPHFHIDYSANLEAIVDISGLCEAIRAEAAQIETFPLAGIRVRAIRVDHWTVADGAGHHGFIDMSVRLREGRSDEVKQNALGRVFATLKDFVEPAMKEHSISLSAEMRDISASLAPKFGNTRDHLKD